MSLDSIVGREVTLRGHAKDAKAMGVLVTPEGSVIYMRGLPSWSSDLINKEIYIKGVLKKGKIIPDPVVDENGGYSTGAHGKQLYFEHSRCKITSVKNS
ncbi:MAG: hypothetical protein JW891_08130 [Candidatus Lokiarchaeota archaeon]|nr:hypothetical protein [Candidatus Lokiarchaeota archaeon]